MTNKIGGFFELEIAKGKSLYHDQAIKLSTGRACLNYILQHQKFKKYYLPYYCCDALFEPLKINDIEFEFYNINNTLEIANPIVLKQDEAIVYCNFFGIKNLYINRLIEQYSEQLIVDNSHSFFTKGYKKVASFTTARKYFGVPDGAFLYMSNHFNVEGIQRNTRISVNHLVNRLIGNQEEGFKEFQSYESTLGSMIERISKVSELILKTVNYPVVRKRRNDNFYIYHQAFKDLNYLKFGSEIKDAFCYPLWLEKPIDKASLFKENIFVPTYWHDVINRVDETGYQLESRLSKEVLHLPIDHRYDEYNINRVIKTIKRLMHGQ